ncbi:exonuclease V a 5' deoxyribonuclease-domain-containing protein [Catenaria anguillulae PL171]|uniref:Exonuclease V a 5' deoxyribonuclease-domain-containing protein n=1 Tax=Catenaria anguillulae PL171 TaxID=765915 RepID=A0A1Y2HX54_9FUNG|nr:exonuclease V a 5' deoxyribonuclease-domain-containing protein [Catenaria anguillulae PL171]
MQRRPEQSTQWPYPHAFPRSRSLPTATPTVSRVTANLHRATSWSNHHPASAPPLMPDRPFPPPTQEQPEHASHPSASARDDSGDDDFWAVAASHLVIGELNQRIHGKWQNGSADAIMADMDDEDDAFWQLAASQDTPIPESAPADRTSDSSSMGRDGLNDEPWAIAAYQDPSSESNPILGRSSPRLAAPKVDMADEFDDAWWAEAADQAALLELAYVTPVTTQLQAMADTPAPRADTPADHDDFDFDDDVFSQTACAYDRKLRHINTPPSQATQPPSASGALAALETPSKPPLSTTPPPVDLPPLTALTVIHPDRPTNRANADSQAPTAPPPLRSASSSRILIRPKPTIVVPSASTSACAGRSTKRKGKAKRKLWERLPRISPTDLSSAAWCEVQWLFTRTYGRDVKLLQSIGCKVDEQVTKRLAAGTDIHAKLELELHDKVQVEAQTYEDRMALKVLETVFCLNELVTKRMTRELRVAGILTHNASDTRLYLSGVIDQLEIQPIAPTPRSEPPPAPTNEASASITGPESHPQPQPRSRIVLSDNKTRRTRSTPTPAQTRTTWIQLATYHRLLTDLFAGTFPPESHLQALDALGDQALCPDVVNYVSGSPALLGLLHEFAPKLDKGMLTLREILTAQHAIATNLFSNVQVSTTVQVHYLDQTSGDKFATVELELNAQEYNAWLEDFLGMVVGKRDPKGVDDIEDAALKCGNCEYAPACAWREDKDQELQRRAREAMVLARATSSGAASASARISSVVMNPAQEGDVEPGAHIDM